jgi:LL-diaminopimelate aminotransferase
MIIRPASKLDRINEYYFSMKLKQIAELRAAGRPIINLGIGNPDQPPSPETIAALRDSAGEPGNQGYQSYIGTPALRSAMSGFYEQRYGVSLDPASEILPLLGSKEGISFISHAFLNPGDKVLVPDPGYPTYTSAAYLAGAEPVSYGLDSANGWLPDLSSLPEGLLREAKLVWINYPNMPTGARGSVAAFEDLISLARRFEFLVVNDNPYSLVLNDGPAVSVLQAEGAKEVCVELNSLSKSHNLAGARIGMACGAGDYISTILKVKSNVDSGMYLPVQQAAVAALSNPAEWHEERNDVYRARRRPARAIMDALGCVYEQDQIGLFIWGRVPEIYSSGEELTEKLLHEADVFITPGMIFGSRGGRYVRISLCSPQDDLEEALRRVVSWRNSW